MAALKTHRRITIVAHDNPDPDALVTGWALVQLLEAYSDARPGLNWTIRFIAGGRVTRAENRYLVERLGVPVALIDRDAEAQRSVIDDDEAVILVDCGLDATHHLAFRAGRRPDAVIDHHLPAKQEKNNSLSPLMERQTTGATGEDEWPIVDCRPKVAAAVSIVIGYFIEQRLQPSSELATGVLYALKSETCGGEHQYSEIDRQAVNFLTPIACHETLARIDEAPLPHSYFVELRSALEKTELFDTAAFCDLESSSGPEVAGEIADFLIRHQDLTHVLCIARVDQQLCQQLSQQLNVSVRVSQDLASRRRRAAERSPDSAPLQQLNASETAAHLTRRLLNGLGSGGGHRYRGGGQIDVAELDCSVDEVVAALKHRWLDVTGNQSAVPKTFRP